MDPRREVIPPRRGERSLAGGERSEPPDRRGTTICTPAGVAGAPRAPAGAHSFIAIFRGFAFAHPRLCPQRPFRSPVLMSKRRIHEIMYLLTRTFNCTQMLEVQRNFQYP